MNSQRCHMAPPLTPRMHKYGFVTVNYTSNAKLKVGIQYGDE